MSGLDLRVADNPRLPSVAIARISNFKREQFGDFFQITEVILDDDNGWP